MIVLLGKSNSGKNIIRSKLADLGYAPITTYTSRPMREGEIQGKTYHFISNEAFLQKVKDGFFIEYISYKVESGETWYYGSSFESVKKTKDKSVIILTPEGYRALKKYLPYETTGFYLNVSDTTILKRQIERKDNPEEAKRRFEADKVDFVNFEYEVDFNIINENRTPLEVAVSIDTIYTNKGYME